MNIEGACVQCGGTRFVTDSEAGEILCQWCGYVAADRMDDGRLPP